MFHEKEEEERPVVGVPGTTVITNFDKARANCVQSVRAALVISLM